jgi:hypothetical protein
VKEVTTPTAYSGISAWVSAGRAAAEDLPGDLRDGRRVAALERQRLQPHGQVRDAKNRLPMIAAITKGSSWR